MRNSTHLELDFQSDNLGGAVIDSVVLTKDRPCVFGAKCAPPPSPSPAAATPNALSTEASLAAVTADVDAAAEGAVAAAAPLLQDAENRDRKIVALRRCWARGSQTRRAGHGVPARGGAGDHTPAGPGRSSYCGDEVTRNAAITAGTAAGAASRSLLLPANPSADPARIPAAQRAMLVAMFHSTGGRWTSGAAWDRVLVRV